MSESLKPCPFCGSTSVDFDAEPLMVAAMCLNCECSTACHGDKHEANAAWNRRASLAEGKAEPAQDDALCAARYRWLRGAARDDARVDALNSINPNPENEAEFDAAIDAAMSPPSAVQAATSGGER